MVSTEEIQLLLTALGPVSFGLSYILFRMLRNTVKSTVFQWASEFKNLVFDEMMKNPQMFEPLVGHFLSKMTEKGPSGKAISIGGWKIPGFLQPVIEQLISRAATKFLPQLAEAGEETVTKSPFG